MNSRPYGTVDPVYSELGYSEYPALMNTFCCTDLFTINGIDCIIIEVRTFKIQLIFAQSSALSFNFKSLDLPSEQIQ
jgi:hypothetical protein